MPRLCEFTNLHAVVQVQLTRHLFAYFPQFDGQLLEVEATDVAGVARALEARALRLDTAESANNKIAQKFARSRSA